jgi:hypothetical protein
MRTYPGDRLKHDAYVASRFYRVIEHNGERLPMSGWAERLGIRAATLSYRLNNGWSVEQALTTPLQPRRRRGVVSDLGPKAGTGGGSTAQETPEITFSAKANSR